MLGLVAGPSVLVAPTYWMVLELQIWKACGEEFGEEEDTKKQTVPLLPKLWLRLPLPSVPNGYDNGSCG